MDQHFLSEAQDYKDSETLFYEGGMNIVMLFTS